MDTTVKLGVVLLVDDEHDLEIGTVRGVARVVTPAEALAEYQ
jgi:hypothetical protein